MSTRNRTTTQARDAQIIAGISKNLQNVPTPITLAAQPFTPQTLTQIFQQRIDLANQVAAARAEWVGLSKQYQRTDANTELVERWLKQYVMNTFGVASPVLADFGFTAPKRTPQTVEQKIAAVAKRQATRKARRTLGKKAKLAIKGTVPETAPPTPTPPSTAPNAHAAPPAAASPVVPASAAPV